MTSRVGVVLESAMHSPGVVAAMLVDSRGCAIETASFIEADLAPLGAAVSELLRQWAVVGTDLGMGTLRSMMIEQTDGPTTITPIGRDTTLLITGNRSRRPGRAWFEAKRAREAVIEVASAQTELDSTAPAPPLDHLDRLARAIEDRSSPRPRALTMGEVILLGAHTFRVVTRLVAQLLQIKGVQSSRMRAHSPKRTVIEVALEEGATLETIDRSGLEEFAIERTEEGGTRLVLRVETALATSSTPSGSSG